MYYKFFNKAFIFTVLSLALFFLAACGGDGGGTTESNNTTTASSDGYSFIYATDKNTNLAFKADKDFKYGEWGSGSKLEGNYTSDKSYNPVFQVIAGKGWGGDAAALGMTDFKAGFASKFGYLHFKIKGVEKIKIKFADAADAGNDREIEYDLSADTANVTDIAGKTGWKQVNIPLSSFTGRATNVQFGIFAGGNVTFYVTDIAFSGTATTPGTGGGGSDSSSDSNSFIYATDKNTTLTYKADTDFKYDVWGSGTVLSGDHSSDTGYNPVFEVKGNSSGWGTVLAMTNFKAGFASKFKNLHFKIKGVEKIKVKFADAADAGNDKEFEYDLSADTAIVTDIAGKTGWKQVNIPLSNFTGRATNTQFAIFAAGNVTFYITDIAFSGTATTPGTGGGGSDSSSDSNSFIYATDKNTTLTYKADTDFKYDVWGTGTVLSGDHSSDPGYNPVFEVKGNSSGWGTVLAMTNFKAGFASKFKNLHFKIKGVEKIKVKFADAADAGNDKEFEYDLSADTANVTGIAGKTGWKQVNIPLSNFTGRATNTQFAIFAAGNVTFYITDIAFSGTATTPGTGGGTGTTTVISTNGDFETGDFSSWTNYANGGTIDVTGDNHGGGKWVAHIKAPPSKNPTIKQEGIGKTKVAGGDNIKITFDIKGSLADGGIVSVQMFSEGNPVTTHNLETITALTNTWANKSYTQKAGSDVARGITFQLAAICGGATNCMADVYVDNVTVAIVK